MNYTTKRLKQWKILILGHSKGQKKAFEFWISRRILNILRRQKVFVQLPQKQQTNSRASANLVSAKLSTSKDSVAIAGDISPNPRFWASLWRWKIWAGDISPIAEIPRFWAPKIGEIGEIWKTVAILAILDH